MQRKIAVLCLAAAVLALSGCKGEAEAREYAQGLIEVLKTYQAEVETKAAAEQKTYSALAKVYSTAADTDLLASLSTDRKERGDRLADLAIGGRPPLGAALIDALKDYATRDTDSTHELLTRESDNYDKYLAGINKLSVDADAVQQAIAALDTLTKKPSLVSELKFLKDFGTDAKNCLGELNCKKLAGDLKSAQDDLANASKKLSDAVKEDARKAELNARIKDLQARQKQAGCDQNPTCPKKDKTASK